MSLAQEIAAKLERSLTTVRSARLPTCIELARTYCTSVVTMRAEIVEVTI